MKIKVIHYFIARLFVRYKMTSEIATKIVFLQEMNPWYTHVDYKLHSNCHENVKFKDIQTITTTSL